MFKKTMIKILPPELLRRIRIYREKKVLGTFPQVICDFSKTAKISVDQCAKMMNDQNCADLWLDALSKMDELGIADQTAGVNPGDQRALFYLARLQGQRSILEIGTHIGSSTASLALGLKNVAGQRAHLVTVDSQDVNDDVKKPWKAFGCNLSPKILTEKLHCADIVKFVVSDSETYLKNCSEKFNFIFIDGDHSGTAVYSDIVLSLPLLSEGGLIVLHDYYHELKPVGPDNEVILGPRIAVRRILRENSTGKVVPLGQLPWPTKQGHHFTSLAFLGHR